MQIQEIAYLQFGKKLMISVIIPVRNRLKLFKNTIESIKSYAMDITDKFEIIILDCDSSDGIEDYVISLKELFDISYVKYDYKGMHGFMNPAYAINLGFRIAKYDSVVNTWAEIKHISPVIKQLLSYVGQNILGKVTEIDYKDPERKRIRLLMGTQEPNRYSQPGMYFIGMFNKSDFFRIGGIDEKFMQSIGYEDKDFGERFKLNFKFKVIDEIEGFHQEHDRGYQRRKLLDKNADLLTLNRMNGVTIVNKNIIPGDTKYIVRRV